MQSQALLLVYFLLASGTFRSKALHGVYGSGAGSKGSSLSMTCSVGCETAIVDRFLSEGHQWHLGHFDPRLSMACTAVEQDSILITKPISPLYIPLHTRTHCFGLTISEGVLIFNNFVQSEMSTPCHTRP